MWGRNGYRILMGGRECHFELDFKGTELDGVDWTCLT